MIECEKCGCEMYDCETCYHEDVGTVCESCLEDLNDE